MINDFTPYFYMQVPDNFKKYQLPILKEWIESKCITNIDIIFEINYS